REYVRAAGYNVVDADGPEEGLAAIERDPAICLIVSDVRMPTTWEGVEFIRTVRRRWPDLPLAAVTAFPDDLADLHGTPECPLLVITKPFLRQHIEHMLALVVRQPRMSQWNSPPPSPYPDTPPPVLLVDGEPDVQRLLHSS